MALSREQSTLSVWEEIKNGDNDDHPLSSAPPVQPHEAVHPCLDRLDYLSLRRYNVIIERTEDGVTSTINNKLARNKWRFTRNSPVVGSS